MTPFPLASPRVGLAAALAVAGLVAAPLRSLGADTTRSSVSFADASKPGLLKIYIANGDLKVHRGDSPTEVSVKSTAKPSDDGEPRKDGLRVLSESSSGFALKADGNVATLDYGRDSWPHEGGAEFDVAVPKNTTLEIQNGWGGSVELTKLEGDISLKGLNCSVRATDLTGGLSVETMNGAVHVTFAKVTKDHPISISSMNGGVEVKVPSDTQAQVRFRTHNGTILTDFPESALKSKAEDLGNTGWAAVAGQNAAVAAHIASEVGKEIAANAREMAEQMKEAAREARESQENDNTHTPPPVPAAKPHAPHPPLPPNIPAISGGKVVTGDLNGGGVLLQVTTMNGDITLRHL